MVRILTVENVCQIVQKIGITQCMTDIVISLEKDYARWQQFEKAPRHAKHFSHGVIELMPICDEKYYAFKYVNGHPYNPQSDRLTVVAVGMLSEVENGYPVMISEMTLLTALRTAGTSALAAKYLARSNSKVMALIGTGSQGEFQALAHHVAIGINHIKYFDLDPKAMEKFKHNLAGFDLKLEGCKDARSAIEGADIITTATADKKAAQIINNDWIGAGVHINGVGGDCPGKTEMDPKLLARSKIVVEYLEQTKLEGEIQNIDLSHVYAELWELVTKRKPGREVEAEVTLFDSVGFALEDYSILKYFYQKAAELDLGRTMDMVPHLTDPKNLFGLLR